MALMQKPFSHIRAGKYLNLGVTPLGLVAGCRFTAFFTFAVFLLACVPYP